MDFALNFTIEEALSQDYSSLGKQHEIYDKSFPGPGSFGLRLNKSGKKSFFVIYNLRGLRRRITLGRYPSMQLLEARNAALDVVRRACDGFDPAKESEDVKTSSTIKELIPRYLTDLDNKGKKSSTIREYRRLLEKEVLPIWKNRKLLDISPADVIELNDHIAEDRGSPVVADRLLSVLSGLFSYAIDKALIEENPVKIKKIERSELREVYKELELAEIKSIWCALENEDPVTALAFKMLIYSGQKPSEVLNMRWQDIKLDWWQVSDGVNSGKRRHEIFLAPEIVRHIRRVKNLMLSEEFVLPSSKRKGQPISSIRKAAKRVAENAELMIPFSPLDLRRSLPKQLLQLGVRPDVIEKILNRHPGNTHLKGYYKDFDYHNDIQTALSKWAKVLTQFEKPPKPEKSGAKVIPLFG